MEPQSSAPVSSDIQFDLMKSGDPESPLRHVPEWISRRLAYLDLSKHVFTNKSRVVGNGTYGDVFRARVTLNGEKQVNVALKRLRIYLKEDVKQICGIADGLAYLHMHEKRMIHSDIKPENILVSDSGDALICDFGCARMMEASLTLGKPTNDKKGTTIYHAPEVLKYEDLTEEVEMSRFTTEADVWAFGMTVYELLTGERPYRKMLDAQVPLAIINGELPSLPSSFEYPLPEVQDVLWTICKRCWDLEPKKRVKMITILAQLQNFQQQRVTLRSYDGQRLNDAVSPSQTVLDIATDGSDFRDANPLHLVSSRLLARLGNFDLSRTHIEFDTHMPIAQGGYGEVFLGNCVFPNGEKVKVADIQLIFEKEVYIWSKLQHPNVLPLLGYTFDDNSGYPQLVSEWMENGTVKEYVYKNPGCDLIRLVTEIAAGLAYLHDKGLIHSDIKPENVLISASGRALICDFGVARMGNASMSLAIPSNTLKGTTRYLAYELVAQEYAQEDIVQHSASSDVWAFGMTVFQLLAQQLPYADRVDAQVLMAVVNRQLPSFPALPETSNPREQEFLRNICQRCWDFNPETRIRSSEILAELHKFRAQNDAGSSELALELTNHNVLEESIMEGEALQTSSSYWLSVWDAPSGKLAARSSYGHISSVSSIAFSVENMRVVTGTVDGTIQLWDAQTAAVIGKPLIMHTESVLSIAFSPEGTHVVSGSKDKTLKLWDGAVSGPVVKILRGNTDSVSSVVFSPDGKKIASGSADGIIRLWDAQTGEAVGEPLKGHATSVSCVSFSPDGLWMASGSDDGMIILRDITASTRSGKPLEGHESGITSIAFSPDGRLFASGSHDWSIRFWNASSGTSDGEHIFVHTDSILFVTFTTDGTRIVSFSKDKTVRRFNANTRTAVCRPVMVDCLNTLPVVVSLDGRYIVSYDGLEKGGDGSAK